MLEKISEYKGYMTWRNLFLGILGFGGVLLAFALVGVIVDKIPTLVTRVIEIATQVFWWYADYLIWALQATRPIGRKSDWGDALLTVFAVSVPFMFAVVGLIASYLIARQIFRYLRALVCIPFVRILFGTWPFAVNSDVWAHKRKLIDDVLLNLGGPVNVKFVEEEGLRERINKHEAHTSLGEVKKHEQLVAEIRFMKAEFFLYYNVVRWIGELPWFKYELRDSITKYTTAYAIPRPWLKSKRST